MSSFFQYRYSIRSNLFFLIGVCLCFYFAYHLIHGDRSIVRLISLSHSIETMSQNNDIIAQKRQNIEQRVVMMRPGSINKDLLEEKVRQALGYKDADELVVVGN